MSSVETPSGDRQATGFERRALDVADQSFADHLAQVFSATDQETVWSLTIRFLRDLGFAHAFYGYSPDSRGTALGSPDEYQILSTLPADVMQEMVARRYFLQSTTFHYALSNTGVAPWSMSAEECGVGAGFVADDDARAFFHRNNLLTGCTIGFPNGRTRGNALMALVGPPGRPQEEIDAMLDRFKNVIFVVATAAHRVLTSLPFNPPNGRLTHRQREVLEWVAEGKTTADIALILAISPPTVEKHLRLARETLGVETTAHALIKAAFLNQVFVADAARGTLSTPDLYLSPVKRP